MSKLEDIVQKSESYCRDFPKNHKLLTGAGIASITLLGSRIIFPELVLAPDYLRHIFVSTTIAYGTTVSAYELTNLFLEDKLNNMDKKKRLLTKTGILAGSLLLGFGTAFVLGEGFEYSQKLGLISSVDSEKIYSPINYESLKLLKPLNNFFSPLKDAVGDKIANKYGIISGLGLGSVYALRHKIAILARSAYSSIQEHFTA